METLRGMVERDWNHPCIVIVSLINESWGINLKEAADRQWLKQAYQEAKKIVPGWLVDDNSACYDNFHMATDIADYHTYSAIPDHAADFDRFVEDLARRPGWLFSPYGDASPKGDEPLVLSEFGNWGLPRIPHDKPWWFSRDFGGSEITKPEGIEQRYADYQYSSLFPTLDALTDATEWHEYASLKYEIESIRSHPEIQGYVITEFTDRQLGIEWLAGHVAKSEGFRRLTGQAAARRRGGASYREAELLCRVRQQRSRSRSLTTVRKLCAAAASPGKSRGHRWQERCRCPASLPPQSHPSARSNSRPRPRPAPAKKATEGGDGFGGENPGGEFLGVLRLSGPATRTAASGFVL